MLYAVTIDPIPAIFFLAEPPGPGEWEVEEGVDLDVPSNLYLGMDGPQKDDQVIARSAVDPKHYKLFKFGKDIASHGFLPTGKYFGGVYSKGSWERMVRDVLPHELEMRRIDNDETDEEGSDASR
jgi:hypothetical protein